jgi:hypothetical protein
MMNHDDKPQKASELPPEVLLAMKRITDSDYSRYAEKLRPLVKGKTVLGSEAGSSGYILFLNDGSWVEAFLLDGYLRWSSGTGQPGDQQRRLLNSPACGNGREKLQVDLPYAGEPCDMHDEIVKAHGKVIKGLAIGETSFNFCFPEGRELDAMIVKDTNGKPALRVFWEQW